ncbi:hypothetical protein ACOMHN_039204 [Nucella lapillus]
MRSHISLFVPPPCDPTSACLCPHHAIPHQPVCAPTMRSHISLFVPPPCDPTSACLCPHHAIPHQPVCAPTMRSHISLFVPPPCETLKRSNQRAALLVAIFSPRDNSVSQWPLWGKERL